METLFILGFIILAIALWLWAVIDITKSRRKEPWSTTLWFWLIIIFPLIGPILYSQLKDKVFKSRTREFHPTFNK
ncbi:PLD nuclease N-terminal domain-containing protein [Flammeovirgaceae bacterium SG7u.111]|nr:PLD nuclease N-terminal domain-containing protein [Flammeovirgaceae bacterium SG7u.132]WPO37030.1 PLD nuclease N-terminal domain-containing protein [Flammeovirgaceae bacterium SG7u.111]